MRVSASQESTLDNLADIVMAAPVDYWPATPAWGALGVLVLVLAARVAFHLYRRWAGNRYRRSALAQLQSLQRCVETDPAGWAQLPRLLKRVALTAFPRPEVARLSGRAWLDFLDRSCAETAFSSESGKLLTTLAYGRPEAWSAVERGQFNELLASSRLWIQKHQREVQ